MPKRSNDFQRLIKRIYEQLDSFSAKITESALLAEIGTNELREVDVLIEYTMPGMTRPTRVAIECRDHGRASDKIWIDGLIGKYGALPVDRVIAVSRKTFTAGAKAKAERAKIEVRTLAAALETDWPHDLFEVDFTTVLHWPIVTGAEAAAEPPWSHGETPAGISIGGMPVEALGFAAWQRKCFADAFAAATQQRGSLGVETPPGTHEFSTVITLAPRSLILTTEAGTEHVVRELVLSGEVTVEHHGLENTRYRFGEVGVTRAQGSDHKGAIDVLAVQEPGKPLSVRISRAAENTRR